MFLALNCANTVRKVSEICKQKVSDRRYLPMKKRIAGNGNRTRMASLEGWNFTIKLCPHRTVNSTVPSDE